MTYVYNCHFERSLNWRIFFLDMITTDKEKTESTFNDYERHNDEAHMTARFTENNKIERGCFNGAFKAHFQMKKFQ